MAAIAPEEIEETEPLVERQTTEDQNCCGKKEYCMVCRKSKKIRNFNKLRPGDHIKMPMIWEKWSPLKHHAIVKDILPISEQEGATHLGGNGPQIAAHKAEVMVIDVPVAGETWCERYVPFKSGPFKVVSHALRGKKEIYCKKSTIKRVDYRRRRNTHEQTLKNAEDRVSKNLNRNYNGCVRNCEHFCVAMVNQDAKDAPKGSP